MLMYQLYLPADAGIREQFVIFQKNRIEEPPFDEMIEAKFDMEELNREVISKLKKWNELEFAEQYINNNGMHNYRCDREFDYESLFNALKSNKASKDK